MKKENCLYCGDVIPEGRQVCINCEELLMNKNREDFLNALCDIAEYVRRSHVYHTEGKECYRRYTVEYVGHIGRTVYN